jgi:diguanylate cyclase (GGDEF)-like protein/PAS domain S-box-containing protein
MKKILSSNQDAVERYQFAIDAAGIGVWDLLLTNHDLLHHSNKLIWNENMFHIFNVDPNTFQGKYSDFEACLHPDDKDKVLKHISQCLNTKAIFKIQFRLISHPGEIRYISAQAQARFNREGKPVRLTGINQDVTDHENEKKHIKKLHRNILDNEKKYRTLFESSNDAIILLENNAFIECNHAALSIFGCPDKDSLLGKHPSYFSPSKQANGRSSLLAANDHIARALREGKASFSWIHQRLNGKVFSAEVLLTPLHLQNRTFIQATVRDTTNIVRLQDKLKFLSTHDVLTGLYNRHGLIHLFSKALAHSKRYHRPLSILMLDVDLFKKINDTYGHLVGDKVLVHLAHILLDTIRSSDTAIRFGGEEFLILLPETDSTNATNLAERIRVNIEHSACSTSQKQNVTCTASIGVATCFQSDAGKTQLLAAADKALYAAKRSGRNQVVATLA